MGEKRHFEFFVLRYVPDAVKEEFVNFGLVLTEIDGQNGGFADARFTTDWRRIRCIDPQAEVEPLERLQREIRGQLTVLKEREVMLKWLQETFSTIVQLSPPKMCVSADPVAEISFLETLYLKPRDAHNVANELVRRETGGKRHIYRMMQENFENAGVWDLLLKGVPVAQYTRAGDPFEFDMAYPLGEKLKIFHAVSLKANVDPGVMLATRYPAIAAGMRARQSVTPVLTAVVDDDLDRRKDEIGFALAMMEESNVSVASISEMPAIAEIARRELRA